MSRYASTGGGRNARIDLRSDTVSRPSAGMRRAMAEAEVGDDVYGDDPTVTALEERVADLLGKEEAVFVASGTASNLTALLSHCGRGDEYIGGNLYHISRYEAGGAAVLGGISPRHIPLNAAGGLDAATVEAAVQADDPHYAVTRLVCVENSWDGRVVPQSDMEAVAEVAQRHGLAMHLDGARLMNAVVASGTCAADLVAPMDTVSLCLSKGLGAPVGSVLTGPSDFIRKARRNRKMLGGGLRQSGVLAACGLYALDHNVERLADDHGNARTLAQRLSEIDGLSVDLDVVQTNMLWPRFDTPPASSLAAHMAERGIVVGEPGADGGLRLVLHLDVDASDLDAIVDGFAGFLA